nr:MAG TPA: hypothetical protein [Bacteriophage sp.]
MIIRHLQIFYALTDLFYSLEDSLHSFLHLFYS